MKRLSVIILFAAIGAAGALSGAGRAYGQERGLQESEHRHGMNLKECMEYAISNSTKIRIKEAEISDARLARRDAILSAFTPRISAQTYAYYNFGRSIDPQTNTYSNVKSFHNNYSASAGLDLFNGFEAVNNLKIAKTSLLMGQTEQKQIEAEICLAVMQAYYNVVYYKRLCEIYEAQAANAEKALKRAEKQEELGQKGHADVVQMAAELSDRQYDLINARNMYDNQLITLGDLMFWPVDEPLLIDTDVEDINNVLYCTATEEIVDNALSSHPGVKLAEGKLRNAEREFNTARWQLLPSVGLYAGWNTSYYTYQGRATQSFGEQFRNNRGEYVQVTLSIPIFNRLQRQSAIGRKRNAVERASAEYDQKIRDINSEVRRAVGDRDGAQAAYLQAQRKAAVQEEAYALNLKKMDQGLISPLEFQTATGNHLKAQADKVKSMLDYLIKQAVVRYYNGEEYINQ